MLRVLSCTLHNVLCLLLPRSQPLFVILPSPGALLQGRPSGGRAHGRPHLPPAREAQDARVRTAQSCLGGASGENGSDNRYIQSTRRRAKRVVVEYMREGLPEVFFWLTFSKSNGRDIEFPSATNNDGEAPHRVWQRYIQCEDIEILHRERMRGQRRVLESRKCSLRGLVRCHGDHDASSRLPRVT